VNYFTFRSLRIHNPRCATFGIFNPHPRIPNPSERAVADFKFATSSERGSCRLSGLLLETGSRPLTTESAGLSEVEIKIIEEEAKQSRFKNSDE
jgi:hypothetical protein